MARRHADELRRKMEQLRGMIGALDHLVHACAGDGRPECPILDDLAGGHGRANGAGDPPPPKAIANARNPHAMRVRATMIGSSTAMRR